MPEALTLVAPVDLGRRARRLDGGEALQDVVGVGGALRDEPGVPGLQQDHLAFEVELGAAPYDVADRLVVAAGLRFRVARFLAVPQAHRDALAVGEVLLAHLAPRRGLRAYLFDALVFGHDPPSYRISSAYLTLPGDRLNARTAGRGARGAEAAQEHCLALHDEPLLAKDAEGSYPP